MGIGCIQMILTNDEKIYILVKDSYDKSLTLN